MDRRSKKMRERKEERHGKGRMKEEKEEKKGSKG